MSSSWTDLDRPPLSGDRIGRAVADSAIWREVVVVARTGSTNADAVAAVRAGGGSGLVVVAEEQLAGRGRFDRTWDAPARSAVLMSMVLRPRASGASLGLAPLLVGVAVAEAVRQVAAVDAVLKWPNDVLVGGRKLGGILIERVDDALVAGVGVNVSVRPGELPVATATSLLIAGGGTDREPLVKEILRAVERRLLAFDAGGGAPDTVLGPYRTLCETIGRRVAVDVPGGVRVVGTAAAVNDDGHLVVGTDDGETRSFAAADVTHVRGKES